jgi:hypothetical protein
MDAETRHQLKTNELGEALQNFGRLNDPRLAYTLVGVILILAAWSIYRYVQASRQQAVAGAWTTIMEAARTPTGFDSNGRQALLALTQERPNAAVAAVAELRLALADWRAARSSNNAEGIEKAAAQLISIADDPVVPAEYRASALYAGAAAREDQERFDDARAMYSRLMAEPDFDGSPFKALAGSEVRLLDERMESITFLPGMPTVNIEDILPADEPAPATLPATETPDSQPTADGKAEAAPATMDDPAPADDSVETATQPAPPIDDGPASEDPETTSP